MKRHGNNFRALFLHKSRIMISGWEFGWSIRKNSGSQQIIITIQIKHGFLEKLEKFLTQMEKRVSFSCELLYNNSNKQRKTGR